MQKADWHDRKSQIKVFVFVSALVILLDQITKLWIRNNIPLNQSIPEQGFFRLTHIQNTGAAFGILENTGSLLILITTVCLLVIFFWYRYLLTKGFKSFLPSITLAFISGGALGNLIDRVWLGYVTDFIDIALGHSFRWPAFNLADSAIVLGSFTLVYFLLFLTKKE